MTDRMEQERAREREVEALIEQEFAGAPPVQEILARAAVRGPRASFGARFGRQLLAAALVLLGVGVTFSLAVFDRGAKSYAATLDAEGPGVARWPSPVLTAARADELDAWDERAAAVKLRCPLHEAQAIARFSQLVSLEVGCSPAKITGMFRGAGPDDGARLAGLQALPELRRLGLGGFPCSARDLAALADLKELDYLELAGLYRPMREGDRRPALLALDAELGAAIAAKSAAAALYVRQPVVAGGIQALAGASLHTLILDGARGVSAAALREVAALRTLRHLELQRFDAASTSALRSAQPVGGDEEISRSAVLTNELMAVIGQLPALETLRLDGCLLDADVVRALPLGLRGLDLSTSAGVGAELGDVVAQMSDLQALGLPLALADEQDAAIRRVWPGDEPPRRLTSTQAATLLQGSPLQSVQLRGAITDEVAAAVAEQVVLRQVTLTPTPGSVALDFLAELPGLERVEFAGTSNEQLWLEPLLRCRALRILVFEDCDGFDVAFDEQAAQSDALRGDGEMPADSPARALLPALPASVAVYRFHKSF